MRTLIIASTIICGSFICSHECYSGPNTSSSWICENDKTLECLGKNLPYSYRQDVKKFFLVYQAEAKNAIVCTPPSKAVALLEFYTSNGVDGEIAEQLADDIENKMIMKETECFLSAAISLPANRLKKVIEKIKRPIFLVDGEIDRCLKKHEKSKKFESFFKIYTSKK